MLLLLIKNFIHFLFWHRRGDKFASKKSLLKRSNRRQSLLHPACVTLTFSLAVCLGYTGPGISSSYSVSIEKQKVSQGMDHIRCQATHISFLCAHILVQLRN